MLQAQFLELALGLLGSQALNKAIVINPELSNVFLPRVVVSYLLNTGVTGKDLFVKSAEMLYTFGINEFTTQGLSKKQLNRLGLGIDALVKSNLVKRPVLKIVLPEPTYTNVLLTKSDFGKVCKGCSDYLVKDGVFTACKCFGTLIKKSLPEDRGIVLSILPEDLGLVQSLLFGV